MIWDPLTEATCPDTTLRAPAKPEPLPPLRVPLEPVPPGEFGAPVGRVPLKVRGAPEPPRPKPPNAPAPQDPFVAGSMVTVVAVMAVGTVRRGPWPPAAVLGAAVPGCTDPDVVDAAIAVMHAPTVTSAREPATVCWMRVDDV